MSEAKVGFVLREVKAGYEYVKVPLSEKQNNAFAFIWLISPKDHFFIFETIQFIISADALYPILLTIEYALFLVGKTWYS